ncbi:MOSC domain-containing protein (plasmid) [Phaeobacter sp. LSS9]|uniref:MOSC domain-containing protein n=1 Tax=unclassified Phaeobacter TaxID=2621772 RepID=UPI000E48606A|nr:MOSC domain-containing protein [Phaeobacter sp. LSS9]AXT36946.1 MOSC domain-containing protein [Phaeobacter sp. LSS9]
MMQPDLSTRIAGIFHGPIANPWADKAPTAIHKTPVHGPQQIDFDGFTRDAQADLTVHGGADKAIHHYASDHYRLWQDEAEMPLTSVPAAFGENIASLGLTEDTLCIGDILRLGTAVVQISQGRQPCWKLGHYTGNTRMPYLFQKTGRTGWYYRVLEPGTAQTGDEITLMERRQPDWTVQRVTRARLTRKVSPEDAAVLAQMEDLAAGWRAAFTRMAEGDTGEDTRARLIGARD